MKKVIVFVIVGLLILGFLFYVVKYEEKSLKDGKEITGKAIEDINNSEDVGDSDGGDFSSSEGGASSESSGGSDNSDGSDSLSNPPSIPDIESHLCGFYFEQYGICSGTCPEGVCVSEGRSCY